MGKNEPGYGLLSDRRFYGGMPNKAMKNETPYIFKVKIPSDVDYIPPIRKFIAEILQIKSFNSKFSFRSEVIVDEICYNAVMYGSQSMDATVDLVCTVYSDRVEFQINDQGGNAENVRRLKSAMAKRDVDFEKEVEYFKSNKGLGLEIVRMLSAEVELKIGKDNVTSIRVVRKREEE
jgi:anti-sigma regulatory factor (Ser/Thr protein kinase)